LTGFALLSKRSPINNNNNNNNLPNNPKITTTMTPLTPSGTLDRFGIRMLYATKPNGREWFMNIDDPSADEIFEAKDQVIYRMPDGQWYAEGNPPDYRTRIMVRSPEGMEFWKNVEMTGYFKVVRTYQAGNVSAETEDAERTFQAYARGGTHSNVLMRGSDGKKRYLNCVGSAYKGRIYFRGDASVAKEIGHSVYASKARHIQDTLTGSWAPIGKNLFSPLVNNYNLTDGQYYGGRWIGLKVIIFDFLENGKEYARIQTYIDDYTSSSSSTTQDGRTDLTPSNNWRLLSDVIDRGDWIDDPEPNPNLIGTLDKLIERCGNPFQTRDEYSKMIITWFGHPDFINDPAYRSIANAASFRWDFCGAEFAFLSVREIGGIR
jgi:hypothetical protein